jgi:hypothetical protein
MAAGHNAFRGSGPNRKHAFKDALTQTGSPDPCNDLVCITSSCPRQSLQNLKHRHRYLASPPCRSRFTQPVFRCRGRRPQHQKTTSRDVRVMSALPLRADTWWLRHEPFKQRTVPSASLPRLPRLAPDRDLQVCRRCVRYRRRGVRIQATRRSRFGRRRSIVSA